MTTTTMIAVPTSCAALCTKLAESAQRIDDELAYAGNCDAIVSVTCCFCKNE